MEYYIIRKSDEELLDIKTFESEKDLSTYLKKHKKVYAYPVEELTSNFEDFDDILDDNY